MVTKTITLYSFDELSKEAQEKAINSLSDINVSHDWWDWTYEDAKRIGLNITYFDTDKWCKGNLLVSLNECCDLIHKEHGPDCETYKTATDYQNQWSALVLKHSDGVHTDQVREGNESEFDNLADEIEEDFKQSILEDYRIILRKEYEYLTSSEAIIETIKSNEYTFTKDGKLENI